MPAASLALAAVLAASQPGPVAEGPLRPPAPQGTTTSDPTLAEIQRQRLSIEWGAMGALTGYAAVNLGVGLGLGFAREQDDALRYFHQMNGWWNAVNLTIGIVGLARLPKQTRTERTELELRDEIRKSRRAYLINAHLDFLYMSAGAASWGAGRLTDIPRLEGYGQSFVLQGAVLLAFDTALYAAHGLNLRRLERSRGRDFRVMPFYGLARGPAPWQRPGESLAGLGAATPTFGLSLQL